MDINITELATLCALGLFLPLFPFSMLFNLLFAKIEQPLVRIVLLITWPLLGLYLIDVLAINTSVQTDMFIDVVLGWAVATALLYALRMLVIRELNHWTGFLATSLWALLWIPVSQGEGLDMLLIDVLGLSAPLVLLIIVGTLLSQRFGAAFAGLYNGIARDLPRLSTILVIAVLAAIGTPLFPTFFNMLSFMMHTSVITAAAVLITWLLWSWGGALIIQGFAIGESDQTEQAEDISKGLGMVLSLTLVILAVVGIGMTGVVT